MISALRSYNKEMDHIDYINSFFFLSYDDVHAAEKLLLLILLPALYARGINSKSPLMKVDACRTYGMQILEVNQDCACH